MIQAPSDIRITCLREQALERPDPVCDRTIDPVVSIRIIPAMKYGNDRAGIFDSWEIVDADTARKTCDKSFFEQNGSGVPKEICWFFNAEQLERGETIAITLQYEGKEYTGRVSNESSDRRRVRIFWKADLGKMFALKRERKQIKATFIRIGENAYSITLGEEGDVPVSIKNTIQKKKLMYQIKHYYLVML